MRVKEDDDVVKAVRGRGDEAAAKSAAVCRLCLVGAAAYNCPKPASGFQAGSGEQVGRGARPGSLVAAPSPVCPCMDAEGGFPPRASRGQLSTGHKRSVRVENSISDLSPATHNHCSAYHKRKESAGDKLCPPRDGLT